DEGQKIAEALGGRKAAILSNHGLLTVGQSVDEAVWWYISLDRSCEVQLEAEAAGKPILIPDEIARSTRDIVGGAMVGWLSFQPLYDRIVREQPDLLQLSE